LAKKTRKEANTAVKNEILNELCSNNDVRIKNNNFEYKRSIVEKK